MAINVSIDEKDLYDFAVSFGGMDKVIRDFESSLFPSEPEVKGASSLFVAAFLLSKNLEDSAYEAAIMSFVDVIKDRALLAKSEHPFHFPEWDPSQSEFLPYATKSDVAIILYAWNCYADRGDGIKVEQYLGPLFSLSGSIMSGVKDGYEGKTVYEGIHQRYKDKLLEMLEGETEAEKRNSIKRQLRAIRSMLKA